MMSLISLVALFVLAKLLRAAISGTYSSANKIKWDEAVVEISLDNGSAWAEIESWSTMVEFDRGEYETTDEYTLDGTRHRDIGDLGPGRVTVTCIYTEQSTDPFKNINDVFEAGTALDQVDIRWSKTNTAGDYLFTTSNGVLVACQLPNPNSTNTQSGKFVFALAVDDALQTTVSA